MTPEDRYGDVRAQAEVIEWDMKGNSFAWPPLPHPVAGAQMLCYKNELWCLGGRDEKGVLLSSAFVLALSTREWRTVNNVIMPPRFGDKKKNVVIFFFF
jgi:hypothetical protein